MKKEKNTECEHANVSREPHHLPEMKSNVTFDSEVSEQTSHDMDTDEDTSIPTIEISAVNDCLQILGESPLRPVSKATLHYAKQKIKKVQLTLKRKILDISQGGKEMVRFLKSP
jgi:hypothetical protein